MPDIRTHIQQKVDICPSIVDIIITVEFMLQQKKHLANFSACGLIGAAPFVFTIICTWTTEVAVDVQMHVGVSIRQFGNMPTRLNPSSALVIIVSQRFDSSDSALDICVHLGRPCSGTVSKSYADYIHLHQYVLSLLILIL